MAPLPDNSTGRYWLDYEAGDNGIEHTMLIRFKGATPDFSDVDGWLLNFLNAVEPSLANGWRPLRARWATAGSDVSIPWSMDTALASFAAAGAGSMTGEQEAREVVYVGRSFTSGRRARLSLYGTVGTTPGNFRWGPGESNLTAPAVFTALEGSPDIFIAIDNTKPTWYRYANVNYNSYWERRQRLG